MQTQTRGQIDPNIFTALGDITFSRFVKLVPTLENNQYCVLAGPGDTPCGISNQRPLNTPSSYVARKGDQFFVYISQQPSQQPWIQVDAAYPQGTLLKPGPGGIGTIADEDGDVYGAQMMQASLRENDIVQCIPMPAAWRTGDAPMVMMAVSPKAAELQRSAFTKSVNRTLACSNSNTSRRQSRSEIDPSVFTAMGNIRFSRFVKLVPALTGLNCVQAGLGDTPCGVSNQRPLTTPSNYVAVKGDQFFVYTSDYPRQQPWIQVDDAYPQGTLLKPGTLGIGTIAEDDGDIYGAIMMQASLLPLDIVQCLVVPAAWVSVPVSTGESWCVSEGAVSGAGVSG